MVSSAPARLILTLKLERAAFERFDALRRAYFPSERNFIPAHLTLFQALPGDQEPSIQQMLHALCSETPRLTLHFPVLRFLGRGVAVEVDAPELIVLHKKLTSTWSGWLSAQDRQGDRPHITIQNKVPPDQARQLSAKLAAGWQPFQTSGEGLVLWRYLGGPLESAGEHRFEGSRAIELPSFFGG
jgi:hypothetical protein